MEVQRELVAVIVDWCISAYYEERYRTRKFTRDEAPRATLAKAVATPSSQDVLRVTDPAESTVPTVTATGSPRCEPRVEDEAVILAEVDTFLTAGGADLQALHAAVTRFVVHCRDAGEPIERIISTLKLIIAGAVFGTTEARAVDAINKHLIAWVLDAYYTREV